MAPMGTFSVFR